MAEFSVATTNVAMGSTLDNINPITIPPLG